MDWLTIVLLVLIVVFVIFRLMPPRGIKSISAGELQEAMKEPKGKQLIDVREPQEYRGGHIQGARNIPIGQVQSAASGIPKDKDTYLICQSGLRSAQAARILKKKGFTNLYNVSGGMKQWKGKIVKK
ncbi:rhodanese-like domain-containing protein [Aneurinibacillus terranovensis]|uniref:rhodanese-like domain-containing protein n=1 Tax=Aneurinibacillus terranovensis TaxID=278991 RepID=UPI000405927C|nr:rhodanese-like domain-containing protein [Aneurinibacillus terranovensis]